MARQRTRAPGAAPDGVGATRGWEPRADGDLRPTLAVSCHAPGGNERRLHPRDPCPVGRPGEAAMKQLIQAIVQALVDKPDEVQIKEVIGEHAHVIELRVAKEDLGKVIGKGGAHASAIRTIMAATSGKEKKRYILEIIEN